HCHIPGYLRHCHYLACNGLSLVRVQQWQLPEQGILVLSVRFGTTGRGVLLFPFLPTEFCVQFFRYSMRILQFLTFALCTPLMLGQSPIPPDLQHASRLILVTTVDWNSSEKMRSIDLYRLGVIVSYNMSQTVPGNGSCIFLHIWRGPGQGTAGCTAMLQEKLEEIINWLNSKVPNALLIQLPQPEY